jgi:hypothetical protein
VIRAQLTQAANNERSLLDMIGTVSARNTELEQVLAKANEILAQYQMAVSLFLNEWRAWDHDGATRAGVDDKIDLLGGLPS